MMTFDDLYPGAKIRYTYWHPDSCMIITEVHDLAAKGYIEDGAVKHKYTYPRYVFNDGGWSIVGNSSLICDIET